ncbi:MAG TPA: trypsin-like serine protease [Actinomycetota bacterium]
MKRRIALMTLALAALPIIPAQADQIVGGRPATRPYPWMASLQSNAGSHFCGGSLVRPDWILTAKHCVSGRQPSSFQVRLGSTSKSSGGQIHQIAEVLTDPNSASDSAVLRLTTPSALTPIRIGMPSEASVWAPGTNAVTIGWGTSFYLVGPSPDELHEVEVPIVSDADCATLNGPVVGFNGSVEICAGEPEGGRDACQGDSGGPLMVPDANGRLIVVGTTWKGLGCGTPMFYGSYASVGENPINGWLRSALPPESSLSIADASAAEGDADGALALTVRRAGVTAQTVRVSFRTAGGTATPKVDYWPLSGTLTFEPDDTTQTILVPILGDDLVEGDETFGVELFDPVEAAISVGAATATIADDD